MKARSILKAEKKQYDENVARAREAALLATQLVDAYQSRKTFSSEDSKKFERLEKLTKKIRNEAGGSETDPDVKDLSEAKMVEAVRNGMGKMQPYKDKLTDTQIKEAVGYFRTFLK